MLQRDGLDEEAAANTFLGQIGLSAISPCSDDDDFSAKGGPHNSAAALALLDRRWRHRARLMGDPRWQAEPEATVARVRSTCFRVTSLSILAAQPPPPHPPPKSESNDFWLLSNNAGADGVVGANF